MKISSRCDYAIRALIYLVVNQDSKPLIHIEEIARDQNIPIKFLAVILLELKKMGIVSSKKGPGGGYGIKCNPNDVSFASLVETIDGKINEYNINFSDKTTNESLNAAAVVKESLDEIETAVLSVAKHLTLREMANRYIKLRDEDDDYEI